MKKMIMLTAIALTALCGGCGWTIMGCKDDNCITVEIPEKNNGDDCKPCGF